MRKIVGADSRGALHVQREDYLDGSMNASQALVRRGRPTPSAATGTPADVIDGADLLIGALRRARAAGARRWRG